MISVNGVEIPETAVLAEMQYHPASSREEAAAMAAEALVVRELLLERAALLGIAFERGDEAGEEGAIDSLLQQELKLPEARADDFSRYYENNKGQFRSPDLFEASHILFLAPRDDDAARARGRDAARRAIDRLTSRPDIFPDIARTESACSSAGEGGRLGQVATGETSPEIDTFLQSLADGQLCPVPVETDYGVHVLLLHRRIPGVTMSFEVALPVIERRLRAHAWGMAVSQYISLLAGNAEVKGIEIRQATSPLVQ
jgi:peptidyl-prolyl cis-trans isomerase C